MTLEGLNATPRYRATKDHTYILGCMRSKGNEFEFNGWPTTAMALEPLNEPARRIATFWQERHGGFIPDSPYISEHGAYYLPGALANFQTASLALPTVEREGMPRYTATREIKLPHGRSKAEGETFACVAWDVPTSKPANDEAGVVQDYIAKYRNSYGLLSSPWCELRQSLFLPKLNAPRVIRTARDEHAERAKYINPRPRVAAPPPGNARRVPA